MNKNQMTPTDKSPLDKLDHPCRETCSGWKQGYERGVMAVKQELDAIKSQQLMETDDGKRTVRCECGFTFSFQDATKLQQELDAAREEIGRKKEYIKILSMGWPAADILKLQKQLADAHQKIKELEERK